MSAFDLTDILDDCAERLSNRQTIEDCLRMYPQYAADLRPMLEVLLLVRRISPASLEVVQARERVRFRIAEAAAELRSRRTSPGLRLLPLVASFIVVFAIIFTVASFGAETSLPGDSLYPLKRFTENARVVVLRDEALAGQFAQRRIDEIRQLQVLQREAEVDFRGLVEQIDGTDWRIAGLSVVVSESVLAGSSVNVGDTAAIEARVAGDGTVTVNRLDILNRGEPVPLPEMTAEPTSTVLPTLTITPQPTATLPPTMTRTPQATATAQPMLTNTPQPPDTPLPTITRTRMPTSTPRPTATLAPTRVDGCSSALPEGWVLHTITVGETMSRLASVTGVSLEELMEINCITNPRLINVGQPIYLPFEPSLPQSSQQGGSSGSQPSGSSSSGSGTSSGGSSGDSSNDDGGDDDDNSGSSGSGSGEDAGDIEDDDGSGEDDDFEDDDGSSGDDDGGDDDNGGSGGDDGSDDDGGGDDDNGDGGDD